jgi:hypothetical protein
VIMNGKMTIDAAPGGAGGGVDIFAGLDLTVSQSILSRSDGIDGLGGDIFLTAGGILQVKASLDVRGRTGTGGSIEAVSTGNFTLTAPMIADGDVQGGTIFIAGCAVSIPNAGSLSAKGPGVFPSGSNNIQAGSTMTISGPIAATARNLLETRALPLPAVTGSNVPPAMRQVNASIPCCVSCPVTTTTSTTTSLASTTSSTTSTTRPTTTTLSTTTTTSSTTTSSTSSTSSTTSSTTTSSTTSTLPGVCGAQPQPACRRPVESLKSPLKLKDSAKKGPSFTWKWDTGASTDLSDFGDPTTTDGVALCLYDRSQATPSLLFSATVPAGGNCGTVAKPKACWVGNGKNFKFKNKAANADGVTTVVLTPGAGGEAKLQLKAKGAKLKGRAFGLPHPPLPLPFTVQLQSQNGRCWEANYSAAGMKTNAGDVFVGKAD